MILRFKFQGDCDGWGVLLLLDTICHYFDGCNLRLCKGDIIIIAINMSVIEKFILVDSFSNQTEKLKNKKIIFF